MASTEQISQPVDHSTPKQAPKIYGREHEEFPERKSLQTLQQSALDDTELVGFGLLPSRHVKSADKTKLKPAQGHVKVFKDIAVSESVRDKHGVVLQESRGTQTDDSLLEDLIQQRVRERTKTHTEEEESEDFELMVKEPAPESYWKEVAEQRRLALSTSLEENQSLHQSVDSLKEENEILSKLANQASDLSSLLLSVVSDNEDDKAEDQGTEEKSSSKDVNDSHDVDNPHNDVDNPHNDVDNPHNDVDPHTSDCHPSPDKTETCVSRTEQREHEEAEHRVDSETESK